MHLFFGFVCLLASAAAWGADDFALSPSEQAWVAAHPVVRIQMGDDSPPFEFRRDGRWQGLAYDHLLAACRRIGIRVEVQEITWEKALAGIATGDGLDLILAVTRSPERERQMLLTKGYLSFPQVIIADRHRRFISGLADLQQATVAVEHSYVMEEWLRRDLPQARLLTPNDTLPALQAVSVGRADAYVGNLATASWLIEQHGLVNLGVVAPSGYGDEEFAMGVRRDWPEFIGLLNRALAEMPDAERQTIRQRWLRVRYDHGLRPLDIALWVLGAASVLLLFIIQLRRMVAARTRDLAREVALRRQREEQLAEAQRIAHLGSWIRDLADGALETSPELRRIVGWPPDRPLTLAAFLEAVPAGDRERLMAVHRAEAEGRDPGDFDYRIIRPTGEVRHVLRRSTVVRDDTGRPVRILGVLLDITERNRLEERLRLAQRMESLGQLAGCVAHDFNNVLTGVLGYTELMRRRTTEPAVLDFADRIAGAVGQATTLTTRLLTFARQGATTAEPFDAHDAIAAVVDLFQAARPGQIEVIRDLAARRHRLHGFAGQFQSSLLNLCINARDAMPDGGTLTIATATEPISDPVLFAPFQVAAGEYLRVTITDTGSGMEPAVLARCLEPLFTTKGERGTGLGLSSVQACIVEHHGALRIASAPGQGTCVSLWLPLADRP